MLVVSEAQLAALTREHVLDRLHRCLSERSTDSALRTLLASPATCHEFWRPWYDRFSTLSEHAIAVRLAFILAAQAHGFDPQLVNADGEDAELAMKCRLEEAGILPFIAFEQD